MPEKPNISIKSWSIDDRPREKMVAKGRQALTDSELLAIILGSGSVGESAVDLSKRILSDHNNDLSLLGKIGINDLVKKYKGVGEAKAINIVACLELGRRRKEASPIEKPKIISSKDAYDLLYPTMSDLVVEEFWVLFTNRASKFIKLERISIGNLHSAVVDARTVVKLALENQATGIILCHNHPSNNMKPSKSDLQITERIKDAAVLFDMIIQDHLIIGDNTYFSFADQGLL